MLEDPLHVPQLYLYSRVDRVTDHEFVDELVEHRRGRGVHVSSKKWETSAHVEHFKQHKEEYTAIVKEYLKRHEIYHPET